MCGTWGLLIVDQLSRPLRALALVPQFRAPSTETQPRWWFEAFGVKHLATEGAP